MFNCIESDALMDVCHALGLPRMEIRQGDEFHDVAIVYSPHPVTVELLLDNGGPISAYMLSDYLLAIAPVDVKEA